MYNIVAFDDHPLVTESLKNILNDEDSNLYYVSFNTIKETKEYLANNEVHYLISDLIADESPGIDLIKSTLAEYSDVRVIVYSGVTNDFIISTLDQMGISAFISKTQNPRAIKEFILNDRSKTRDIIDKAIQIQKLTSREKEIVTDLVKGLSSKQIADKFDVSVNTINNQKNGLLKKYECANSTELIAKLAKLGYISLV